MFEAEHLRLGKTFALKLLRPELDIGRRTAQRFRREARAIGRLKSEHIVSVVDCGELDDGTPYLVMEFLEGEDLRSLLDREGSLPARRAVPLVIEACRGLSEVHGAGLVHRDLKPENLFVTRRSTGEDWCKILDFGVAKMESSLSTAEGAIVGTVRYMAPEQLTDSAAVSAPSDIYALGAILYECLAGRPLVEGTNIQEVMYRIMNAEPAPLSELVPGLPPSLVGVIERCLRKSPTGRPASAEQLAALLQASVAVSAQPSANDTVAEDETFKLAVPVRRSAPRLPAAAVLAAMVMTGFAGWYARGSEASPAHNEPSSAAAAKGAMATHVLGVTPEITTSIAAALPATAPAAASGSSPTSNGPAPPAPSSKRLPSLGPRLVSSAGVGTPAANRFDSTNPYAE